MIERAIVIVVLAAGCIMPPITVAPEPGEPVCEPVILVRSEAEEPPRMDGTPRFRVLSVRVENVGAEPLPCDVEVIAEGWPARHLLGPSRGAGGATVTTRQRLPFEVGAANSARFTCGGVEFRAWIETEN